MLQSLNWTCTELRRRLRSPTYPSYAAMEAEKHGRHPSSLPRLDLPYHGLAIAVIRRGKAKGPWGLARTVQVNSVGTLDSKGGEGEQEYYLIRITFFWSPRDWRGVMLGGTSRTKQQVKTSRSLKIIRQRRLHTYKHRPCYYRRTVTCQYVMTGQQIQSTLLAMSLWVS